MPFALCSILGTTHFFPFCFAANLTAGVRTAACTSCYNRFPACCMDVDITEIALGCVSIYCEGLGFRFLDAACCAKRSIIYYRYSICMHAVLLRLAVCRCTPAAAACCCIYTYVQCGCCCIFCCCCRRYTTSSVYCCRCTNSYEKRECACFLVSVALSLRSTMITFCTPCLAVRNVAFSVMSQLKRKMRPALKNHPTSLETQ